MSKGTPRKQIRMSDGLWAIFGAIARKNGTDRTQLIRGWILWYVGLSDEAPTRPEPEPDASEKNDT